jgi:HAD superfamily hydrolase (TIGR01509 family)
VRNVFSPVIISANQGLTKPAARLYWRAIDQLQINPGQVLFVDDTMENVTGARCVGLAAVRFQQNWQAIRDIERVLNDSG